MVIDILHYLVFLYWVWKYVVKDSHYNSGNSVPFQVHYYNETHAVWEPLIERVEEKKPWNLSLTVRKS